MQSKVSSSVLSGFSKLSFSRRLHELATFAHLSHEDLEILMDGDALRLGQAEHLIENVIGRFSLPLGLATNFLIDGRDVAIPMAVEETSIVAAASRAAKWIRSNGGIQTRILGNRIIGQVQFPSVRSPERLAQKIEKKKDRLIDEANAVLPGLKRRGGGIDELQVRLIRRPDGQSMAVVHLLCNPCDAMGANLINLACEALKAPLEKITGEAVGLCILSNLVDTRLVEATCEIQNIEPLMGNAIAEATLFASLDPYRCATHNKGVMNAIDAILIATGNDWRAVEAGVHAFAAGDKSYKPITHWAYEGRVLRGTFRGPIAAGIVGGMTRLHPTAKVCLKILGITKADELARICAAAGLNQNLAALHALCGEGIVRGHMRLHLSNLAMAAGAKGEEIPQVQEALAHERTPTLSKASEVLVGIRASSHV